MDNNFEVAVLSDTEEENDDETETDDSTTEEAGPNETEPVHIESVATDENPEDLVAYDVGRSTEHSYLGTRLSRVSGIHCLEDGLTYKLPLLRHSVVIFPGDSVPVMSRYELDFFNTIPRTDSEEEGLVFGLIFPKSDDNRFFGVTCQIYEMSSAPSEAVRIKSRSQQRFEIRRKNNPQFVDEFADMHIRGLFANVTILPETMMNDPLYGSETTSLSKFRYNDNMKPKLRQMCSASLSWPLFVYDMYDTQAIVVKIKSFLSAMQIDKYPQDEVALSYWCGKNVLIDAKDRLRLFRTNSITERMLIIGKSLDYARFFVCKQCHRKLAHYNSLFAMSSEGFQSSYCNPGGYIHETNTVTHLIPNSVRLQGSPTLQYSWFPGYTWQLAMCGHCNSHLGWKFVAEPTSNLMPRKFFGLAGRSIALWKHSTSIEDIE